MRENHLWYSIFSHHHRHPHQWNDFTRVQRSTCCFVLFYLSMLWDILYYDLSTTTTTSSSSSSLQVGSLRISTQQVCSAFVSQTKNEDRSSSHRSSLVFYWNCSPFYLVSFSCKSFVAFDPHPFDRRSNLDGLYHHTHCMSSISSV